MAASTFPRSCPTSSPSSDVSVPLSRTLTADWIAFFIAVTAEEHFIFRRRMGYDFAVYNDLKGLPIGIAGIIACCCGAAMAVVSMAQVWYIGPLGAVFGEYGGDLGFEMSFVTTAIVYPPLRWAELRYFGR